MMSLKRVTALIISMLLLISCIFPVAALETPLATLMFASDHQKNSEVHPLDTLTNIASVISSDGKQVDSFIMCGDMTIDGANYNGAELQTRLAVSRSKKAIRSAFGDDTEYHLLQGNHDPFLSDIMDDNGPLEYDDYILYILNTQSANPWGQGVTGAEEVLKSTADILNDYLEELVYSGESRPVIIATHVPLHFSGRTGQQIGHFEGNIVVHGGSGDNMYSRYLFDVINKWAQYLNIVFLFGHNHDKGYDNYLGYGSVYLPIGSNILIPDFEGVTDTFTNKYTVEKLNFTYMNAGYIGFVDFSESEENADLTCSVIEVYDNRLEITRYSSDGVHCLSGEGAYSTNEEYPDSYIFKELDESLLSEKVESTASILRIAGHVHSFCDGVCSDCGYENPEYDITSIGDVDYDGKITLKDVNILKRIILGVEKENIRADLNEDGKVTVSDIQILKLMLLGN